MLQRLFFQFSYYRKPPWDTGISPPELIEFIESHPPGRAIDIGCGTGTNVITLARSGWIVTGVDFTPRAVHLARQKIKAAAVRAEISVNDATKLNGIPGPFDLALDIGCFHSLGRSDQGKYLDQLDRILAPRWDSGSCMAFSAGCGSRAAGTCGGGYRSHLHQVDSRLPPRRVR